MTGRTDTKPLLDRYTSMGDLTAKVCGMTKASLPFAAAILASATVYLLVHLKSFVTAP
jgi:hypothetical protein